MNPSNLVSLTTAVAVMTLLGYFVADLLCRSRHRSVALAVAPLVGAGICSVVFFVFRRPMFTIEFLLLITLAGVWFRYRWRRLGGSAFVVSWKHVLLGVCVSGAVGFALSGMVLRVDRLPHGEWDGWAIWNSHARFLYRDGPAWQRVIQGGNTNAADYPLLTPSLTARFWLYAGQEIPDAGGFLGIIFALSGIAMLQVTLSASRGLSIGTLMTLALVGTPFYLAHATSQYADLPLSSYILSTIALICIQSEEVSDHRGLLVLAGFTAGCAGWTKNEGLLLIVSACVALLIPAFRNRSAALHRFVAFFGGLIVPLILIVAFKFTIAPPNDLTANRNLHEILAKISDPDRYVMILTTLSATLRSFGMWTFSPALPLLVFLAMKGIHRATLSNSGWLTSMAILGIVFAGYLVIYVVTPMDLRWHLDTSLNRLLLQLWPSFLLLVGLLARKTPVDVQEVSEQEAGVRHAH